jgi:hypothetical protein
MPLHESWKDKQLRRAVLTENFRNKMCHLEEKLHCQTLIRIRNVQPVPVATLSKAYVNGRWPTAIMGSNPTGGMDTYLLCVLCVVR